MTAQAIEEVRLTAFKSFRGEALRLAPLTVLIGRNSSGKSNALDGLEVLSRLSRGEDIAEALESRRSAAGPVRGGLAGCVPHGEDSFSLGCTVSTDDGPIRLDVTIQVDPEVRIIKERLEGPTTSGRKPLLACDGAALKGDVRASWHDGKPGRNRSGFFRGSRLLTSQLPLRIAGDTEGERDTIRGAETMLSALSSVFHLDPVPHLMRQYVPSRDVRIRRTAENLSGAIGGIQKQDQPLFRRLVELLRGLADHQIETLAVTRSDLGDVMLALDEGDGGLTPAREMSDGMLRFLAIATSLLTGRGGLDLGASSSGQPDERSLMLVIEELENGLHPSQASEVLQLVRQASEENNSQVLITTHSPALLSAMDSRDHEGVVVCSRDRESGTSRLARLTDLDGYAVAMAAGPLGDVVTQGRLRGGERPERDYSELDRLLGIG